MDRHKISQLANAHRSATRVKCITCLGAERQVPMTYNSANLSLSFRETGMQGDKAAYP